MEALELWYFYNDDCSICKSLWPKVEGLLKHSFPQLPYRYLKASDHRELAGQHRMLSVPGILFFVEGREFFRANGLLSLQELERQLHPAYQAYFGEAKTWLNSGFYMSIIIF